MASGWSVPSSTTAWSSSSIEGIGGRSSPICWAFTRPANRFCLDIRPRGPAIVATFQDGGPLLLPRLATWILPIGVLPVRGRTSIRMAIPCWTSLRGHEEPGTSDGGSGPVHRPPGRERRLGGRETCNGHAERGAGNVVHPQPVTERH